MSCKCGHLESEHFTVEPPFSCKPMIPCVKCDCKNYDAVPKEEQ